ncbi:hypothetical protein UFOVP407_49 [uncultured Caudovirales phage]|uniref:Uncharacterized protein n=1 Tax=uncultured Caudovirales phage TaxID=2100421 RepID=A0A6J5M287_9CAUD|nr:hypothetical protein UFOVP407_49 [uncultured Caudovirales phage]
MLDLLDRLGRVRALKEDESVLLEKTIRLQTERLRHRGAVQRSYATWTAAMDRKLLAATSPSKRREFAEAHGVSMRAVKERVMRLKRAGATTRGKG